MNTTSKQPSFELPIKTTVGDFWARYSEKGLAGLDFPSRANGHSASLDRQTPATIKRWHRATTAAVERGLAGRAPKTVPPLDLSSGTAFQRRVWNALTEIGPGHTRSYGEIARRIGNPKAVRAVGAACGANPVPILIPCHRVLAANQKLGGFSGGLHWKRRLLSQEGVEAQ